MKLLFLILAMSSLFAAEVPQAEISNGPITAVLYLPDAAHGYYQGTRFDWAGVISSLKYQGHQYFGQWFEKYDPKTHDAIMGPVEEFLRPLGYDEAKVGGTFVRVGVGLLRKPEEKEFRRFFTYEIADPGKRTIHKHADSVEFRHEVSDATSGYAYQYQKSVRLTKGKPQLVLDHTLKNTGRKAISTEVYDHNFFMIDGQPTGPEMSVKFPWDLQATGNREVLDLKGSTLTYSRPQTKSDTVMAEFKGYNDTPKDFDFRIENRKTGAGVHITANRPLAKVLFWSIPTVLCPEPYIKVEIAPGQEFTWRIVYDFYVNAPATASIHP
jgi:hypothetical protein